MSQGFAEIKAGQHRWQWWPYLALAVVVLLALAPFDVPVAQLCYRETLPRAIARPLEIIADVAGGGLGIPVILIAIVVFDRTKLGRLPLLISASLGAGLLADIVKLCVCRARPHSIDLSTATFYSTFYGWFPFFAVGSGRQSFPSGHAATAVGFAIALSISYPRQRWFFFLLAVAVSFSRIIQHAHFPTDIAAGAMLGGAWAFACHGSFAAPAFVWCERLIERSIVQLQNRYQPTAAPRPGQAKSGCASDVTPKNNSDQRNAA